MIEPVVIGLGGNVGTEAEVVERFGRARASLSALSAVRAVRSAPLYRSAPLGPAQPAFLNTAVCLDLAGAVPAELLAELHAIERQLGRSRAHEPRWGPRPIDLDLLVWGDRRLVVPVSELAPAGAGEPPVTALELPHPRLAERRFALAPVVALLGAGFAVPGLASAGELVARVADQDCELIAAAW